jgi:hypothetical protein
MMESGFGQALWRDIRVQPTITGGINASCPADDWVWISEIGGADIGTIMDEVEQHLTEKHDGSP